MAKSLLINEFELSALDGQPYVLMALYIYLRRFMDYGSGIVGLKRGISYQAISEALYIEPHQGIKSGSPHRSAIRRAVEQLERIGLARRIGGMDNLVFKLPLAQTDRSVLKKADTNPTPQADTGKATPHKAERNKADTGKKAKADTPPASGNSSDIGTTTTALQAAGSSSNSLIFPKHTDEGSQKSMAAMLKGINQTDQQELLDELQGCIEKGKVQSVPAALLHGMVKRYKAGGFNPVYASRVKAAREKPPAAERKPPPKRDLQKGREHMGNVRQLFKRKGSNA